MIHPFDLKFKMGLSEASPAPRGAACNFLQMLPCGLGMRVLNNANMMALN